mmetsp:Transcript_6945/g.11154  ORF Transcript_6945/g.11154 Transcript_6945/m.11154 type:complete len:148 (+) Transcript_6945:2055-2498(+)
MRQPSHRSSRSKSNQRYEQAVSEYERDLSSMEKGSLKFNRFQPGQDEMVSKYNDSHLEANFQDLRAQQREDQDEATATKEEVFHSRDVNLAPSRNSHKNRQVETEQAYLRMEASKTADEGAALGHHNTVPEVVNNVTGSFNRNELAE